MVQPDLKKLVAVFKRQPPWLRRPWHRSHEHAGRSGAVYQMLNHGVSTGGLFLIVGMLSDRRHTRLISEFGGLKLVMPRLVAAFLLITLSSIWIARPERFCRRVSDSSGRVHLESPVAAFAATGVILSATYMLWMFQRVNYGSVSEKNSALPDLKPREWALIVPIVAMAVLMGVFPNLFLRPMGPSVERMINQARRGSSIEIRAGR